MTRSSSTRTFCFRAEVLEEALVLMSSCFWVRMKHSLICVCDADVQTSRRNLLLQEVEPLPRQET